MKSRLTTSKPPLYLGWHVSQCANPLRISSPGYQHAFHNVLKYPWEYPDQDTNLRISSPGYQHAFDNVLEYPEISGYQLENILPGIPTCLCPHLLISPLNVSMLEQFVSKCSLALTAPREVHGVLHIAAPIWKWKIYKNVKNLHWCPWSKENKLTALLGWYWPGC